MIRISIKNKYAYVFTQHAMAEGGRQKGRKETTRLTQSVATIISMSLDTLPMHSRELTSTEQKPACLPDTGEMTNARYHTRTVTFNFQV